MSETTNTGLVANVTNGVLNYKASEETKSATTRGSSELGKEAFLQLLVCQMQNQDPLDPSTDTEYVAQLAQFSQLEQLQNLSSTTEKSQAFSLVGKYCIFEIEDTNGKVTYPEGTVDFVNISGSDVTLSVDGKTYKYEELYTVVDEEYYISRNLPSIEDPTAYVYNALSPEDLMFEVDFGKNEYKASEVAMVVGGQQIDGSHISIRNNVVTVDKDAFSGFANGEYSVSVVFNNKLYTSINDKVKVTVYNSSVEPGEQTD